jgi:hypothetical protein
LKLAFRTFTFRFRSVGVKNWGWGNLRLNWLLRHFRPFKMSSPHRHINLAMLKKQEALHPNMLSVASAKSGHTAEGKPFGSKYDRNFYNEFSQFHAMPKKTVLMNEVTPRKVIRNAK